MAVDKVGNLYVVDEKRHRVLKYSADGRFERDFGKYGDAADGIYRTFSDSRIGGPERSLSRIQRST